jgi:hypothetical protein
MTKLRSDPEVALARAEAAFKRKEDQRREGEQAMAEYQAQAIAIREKTARLRALRLARDDAGRRTGAAAKRAPEALVAKRKTA